MKLWDLPTPIAPYAVESDEHRTPPCEHLGHGSFWCLERQIIPQSIDTTYEAFTPNKNCANPYPAESFS
jgi:hypothetical protein